MQKALYKASTAVATLSLLASSFSGLVGADVTGTAINDTTGADSNNEAEIEIESTKVLEQSNEAKIKNLIYQDLNTGDNEANKNTGMGSVSTGDVESVSLVQNQANQNMASVGGSGNDGGDPILSAVNDTTGADSKNEAEIEVEISDWVVQSNRADILNDAGIFVNTGWNEANKNTGPGEVETGDIDTGIGFDTEANANFLTYDGCCDVELGVGNHKTGFDSENEAEAELETVNTIFQGNCTQDFGQGGFDLLGGRGGHHRQCGVANLVYGDLNTGDNTTNKNTADGIDTGDVEAAVEVYTQENENVLGSSLMDWPDIEWGELPEDGGWWWLFFGYSA
jgi:hypothetical protein